MHVHDAHLPGAVHVRVFDPLADVLRGEIRALHAAQAHQVGGGDLFAGIIDVERVKELLDVLKVRGPRSLAASEDAGSGGSGGRPARSVRGTALRTNTTRG